MSQPIELLSNLALGTNWTTIRVRVARLWVLISNNTNEPYSLNLQLLDAAGNQKLAVIRRYIFQQFENSFEEGAVYDIARFNIQNSETTYKVIDEDLIIVFKNDTRVARVDDVGADIPTHKFGFVDDKVLYSRVDKKGQLTDVGGLLCSMSDVFSVTKKDGTQTIKRELHIETISGKMAIVTLWSDKKNLVDESLMETYAHPIPIVVTSTTVSTFGRSFTYYSTKATKLYLNINIPHIDEVFNRLEYSTTRKLTLITHGSTAKTKNEVETIETTIKDLIDDVRAANCRGKKYIVNATILKMKTSGSWSYIACPMCKRCVHFEGSNYLCDGCHETVHNPVNKYRVNVDILDASMSTTITVFDKEAEGLLGLDVDEMINISKMENGDSKVVNFFQKLVGTDAVFEFVPTNYDINTKDSNLTAKRIIKKSPSHKTTSVHSQINAPSEQSMSLDIFSSSTVHTPPDSDYKGKHIAVDQSPTKNTKAQNGPPSTKKSGRRGIFIDEDAHASMPMDAPTTKTQDKRRKKDI